MPCRIFIRLVTCSSKPVFQVASADSWAFTKNTADARRIPACHKSTVIIHWASTAVLGIRITCQQAPQLCDVWQTPIVITAQNQLVTVLNGRLWGKSNIIIVICFSLWILPAQVGIWKSYFVLSPPAETFSSAAVNAAVLNTCGAI